MLAPCIREAMLPEVPSKHGFDGSQSGGKPPHSKKLDSRFRGNDTRRTIGG